MPNTKGQTERREYIRHPIQTDSFVTLGPDHTIVGQIIDIGLGGLGFRYIDSKELPDESHLDMHMSEHDLCLNRVPFRTTSDS